MKNVISNNNSVLWTVSNKLPHELTVNTNQTAVNECHDIMFRAQEALTCLSIHKHAATAYSADESKHTHWQYVIALT